MDALKSNLKLCGGQAKFWIFEMFQTIADILQDTKLGPSFSNWFTITYFRFQKSLSITFQTQKTSKLGRNGLDPLQIH